MVAHHVSVIGVLATGARRMLRRDPDATDEALATIEETSRTALREMRRLLTVLRTEAEPDVELAPQPGLAGIGALVEQVREAGLPVTLRVDGGCETLDPGVALTVYRIVQEALTNTLKHAGDATAEVRLELRQPVARGGDLRHRARTRRRWPTGSATAWSACGSGSPSTAVRCAPDRRPGGGFRVYARIPMERSGATRRASAAARPHVRLAEREEQ